MFLDQKFCAEGGAVQLRKWFCLVKKSLRFVWLRLVKILQSRTLVALFVKHSLNLKCTGLASDMYLNNGNFFVEG